MSLAVICRHYLFKMSLAVICRYYLFRMGLTVNRRSHEVPKLPKVLNAPKLHKVAKVP